MKTVGPRRHSRNLPAAMTAAVSACRWTRVVVCLPVMARLSLVCAYISEGKAVESAIEKY